MEYAPGYIDMALFDRLPKPIRRALAEADFSFSVQDVAIAARASNLSVSETVELVRFNDERLTEVSERMDRRNGWKTKAR